VIVLDTNVVSEAMRPRPEPRVIRWLDSHPIRSFAVTSVTVAELLFGIRRLPEGRRRSDLQEAFETFMARGIRERVLAFDQAAAEAYAQLAIDRIRGGRPMQAFDAMIAGIVIATGAELATRDRAGFEDCGIQLVDPWA
jgi:predicted nucleic acid-binding protein